MNMIGYIFERCLVAIVNKMAEEKFSSHSEFAKLAFPLAEAPTNNWRHVRNGSNRGKARRLGVEDAYNIAAALAIDIEVLFWKTRREIEEGWTLEQDIANLASRTKAGRPPKNKPLPLKNEDLEKNTHLP